MKQKNSLRVLVAMSGGVDSSVAALLMKKRGYEVIGAFMKNWSDTKNYLGECTWKEDRKMAMKIAAKLKIPLITFDFEKEYRKEVIDKMFKLYKKGLTPNPDIDCNQKIKFPLLRKAAKKLKADFIVTGHYSRIKKTKKNYNLLRAKDESKDQSYFLYRLSQEDLKCSLFPIGNYTKTCVRKIAKNHGFSNFNRKGTVGICFIGKVNFKEFLQKKIKPKKGKIISPEGKLIGKHDGIYYYTIGQRLGPRFGIEISKNSDSKKQLKRWYVASKNPEKNEIIAAPEGHSLLYRKEIIIKKPHWINKVEIKNLFRKKKFDNKVKSVINNKLLDGDGGVDGGLKVHARIRQVGELIPSELFYNKKIKKYKVTLNKPITGISEGQAIVLYKPKSKKVLGGGVIGF